MAITTAEELLCATELGRCELVRGEVRTMIPPGYRHGRIVVRIASRLDAHVNAHGLGAVVVETGFLLARDPDTVRAPDVAFLRAERAEGPERGYYPGAPDLAIEVRSPDDRPGYLADKVEEWLERGAQGVWVVDPNTRTVTIHITDAAPVALTASDELIGDPLIPGLRFRVADILA